jgi:hypothetical protein
MSSSKYPLLAARWRAVVGLCLMLPGGWVKADPADAAALPSSDEIQGITPSSAPTFSEVSTSPRVIRATFSGLHLFGGQFVNLTAIAGGALQGELRGVSISIAQSYFSGETPPTAGSDYTWASDLTILVASVSGSNPNIDNTSARNLQLQVGGTTGFLSSTSDPLLNPEREFWYPDILTDPKTSASASYLLLSPIVLQGTDAIWLGHGFMTSALADQSTEGTWTGYVDFTFTGSGGSGVPDASRTALLLAPGTLLLLGLAGRSRRRG